MNSRVCNYCGATTKTDTVKCVNCGANCEPKQISAVKPRALLTPVTLVSLVFLGGVVLALELLEDQDARQRALATTSPNPKTVQLTFNKSQKKQQISQSPGSVNKNVIRQQEPIIIPKKSYSSSAKLHVVGVYKGEPKTPEDSKPWWAKCPVTATGTIDKKQITQCHQQHAGKRAEGTIDVSIHSSGDPIVLVLMAYEPVVWNIYNYSSAKIEGILLSGYYAQRVTRIDKKIMVDVYTHKASKCRHCQIHNGSFYAYKKDSEQFQQAMQQIYEITQLKPSSFQGNYEGASFAIY